jgi:hypothetical protein
MADKIEEGKPASGSNGTSDLTATAPRTQNEGCLLTVNRIINGTIERGLYALGRFVGRRPILTIMLSVLAATALASGITQLKNEER